jgi:hypothetical protein
VIGAPAKWTDNLLSQHQVSGVTSARRGVARRIPHSALLHLALTHQLHHAVGMGVRDALELAAQLLDGGTGETRRGPVHITLDRQSFERAIERRIREVLESAPSPRRGRPPAQRSRQ